MLAIGDNDTVTVTDMGHIIEVQYMEKQNRTNHIKKLDKDRYIELGTGEIKEFEHAENRGQLENSLKQTFRKLRYLINNNFGKAENELWMTLTYAENMQDTKRLYQDMKNFIKRLRYKYRDITTIDYLSVVEPQGRGAWHVHVLMRLNDIKKAYIANKELAELWGYGYVKVNRLNSVDNIGAYVSAYLTDLDFEGNLAESVTAVTKEGKQMVYKDKQGEKKAFVKGGRIHMYPQGMNIYRCSRGIKMPERKRMKYKQLKEKVGPAQPTFEKEYTLKIDDFESVISIQEYNLKRIG